MEADFLSRHHLKRSDFKLASSEFRRVHQRLQVWPTLDAFTAKEIPKYMTWYQDPRVVTINALDY